jgi:hypothetical protein
LLELEELELQAGVTLEESAKFRLVPNQAAKPAFRNAPHRRRAPIWTARGLARNFEALEAAR